MDPVLVDDVVWGCVSQVGEQTFDIARTAVLSAGWPESVPGTTVDRQCGSSQQALHFAAAGVVAGHYDLAVAGGVESMSRVPMGSAMLANPLGEDYRSAVRRRLPEPGRRRRDDRRIVGPVARRSWTSSPWPATRRRRGAGQRRVHGADRARPDAPTARCPRTRASGAAARSEKLAGLKPAFKEDGVITAANASQISDGAAALLVTTSERAAELGLRPIARVHTAVVVGSAPMPMLTGPIPATQKALQRAGLRIDDIGAFEVNEAFASVPLAWLAELGADEKALNPLGGAIALGHPLGGSGARLATTLVHHMRDHGHPVRPADHVRGRRPGQRDRPRAAVSARTGASHPHGNSIGAPLVPCAGPACGRLRR